MTSTRTRLLNWEACINTRDLGGYPLQGGGETRWQAMVRSDSSALLTPAGQKALLAYGIRTVIDLRFANELEKSPSPFVKCSRSPGWTGDDWPDYLHIPLDNDQDLTWPSTLSAAVLMCDLDIRLLEQNRAHVAGVLTAIAHARPGGVLFHCHAGKDRTGLIAAVLLSSLGVPGEVIVSDYAFTYPLLDERRTIPDDLPYPAEKLAYWRVLSSSLPETMQMFLDYLEDHYHGAEGYLKTTPLLPGNLDLLRERLVSG
ncbi:MAG: tyrosine-protein phosphatase [Omnitrophica WOR_2 bacterium]